MVAHVTSTVCCFKELVCASSIAALLPCHSFCMLLEVAAVRHCPLSNSWHGGSTWGCHQALLIVNQEHGTLYVCRTVVNVRVHGIKDDSSLKSSSCTVSLGWSGAVILAVYNVEAVWDNEQLGR